METYDLELVQGATYERVFRWLSDGVLQPLTGYSVRSQVRARESIASALLLDLTQYCVIEADEIKMTVPAQATAVLDPRMFRRAAWDLFLVSPDPSSTFRLLEGAATCNPAATEVFA